MRMDGSYDPWPRLPQQKADQTLCHHLRPGEFCVVMAMPHDVRPAATGEPGIFFSAPFLPIENSLTMSDAAPGQLPHA